ncbi:MAG: MobA protein [Muribaculaceae bacterium]|nr:MobA protein [Muribaculaceae bacterium]
MKQKFNQGGRPHKINPAAYRYVVRFDAAENGVFLTLYEKSGAINKATFIKNVLLGKSFKVFVVDENTRVFIDKLSSFNSQYRTIGIEYNTVVKTLREDFNEKKAMKALYKLEQLTIELVKLNREIVALAKDFDERWSQKSL